MSTLTARAARLRLSPYLFIVLAFAALVAAPLTAPGYFMFAHDARHTVYFMQMFDAALRDGNLFPRWATDMVFGYGYPVWLILAPLPYYFAEFFHFLGLDFPAAIKAVELVAWFASALAMYGFAARVLGRAGGVVAAVAYLFVPYHLVDLYVRGAMAEFLSFVFPPLILWAIYDLFETRRLRAVPLAALAYAALILTHISMAVLFSPVIVGYILVLWWVGTRQATNDGRRTTNDKAPSAIRHQPSAISRAWIFFTRHTSPVTLSFLALFWGACLSAVFLLPVLAEQRYLTSDPLIGGFFDFRLHFLTPAQLVSPLWGYGYAGVNGADQFSLQLGILPVFFGVIALFSLKRGEAVSAQLAYFGVVLGVGVLAMLSITTSLWDLAAPVIAFAQFPWRLLFVTATALALLAGASLRVVESQLGLDGDGGLRGALVLALLLALAMFPAAHPQYTETQFTWNTLMDFEVKDRELLGDTIWTHTRPQDSPLVDQYRAGSITQKAVWVEGDGIIQLTDRRPSGDTLAVNANAPGKLLFYTRYFPGWTASVDGAAVPVEPYGDQGLILVNVPAGAHTVSTHWGTTLPRILGAIISLLSAAAVVVWLWSPRRQARRQDKPETL